MNQLSPEDVKKRLQEPDIYLLDVREVFEHEAFNIGGKVIPLGDIISMAENIPTDIPVIIYCKRGIRSQIAIQRLQAKFGFTNLINLEGGMEAWKKIIR